MMHLGMIAHGSVLVGVKKLGKEMYSIRTLENPLQTVDCHDWDRRAFDRIHSCCLQLQGRVLLAYSVLVMCKPAQLSVKTLKGPAEAQINSAFVFGYSNVAVPSSDLLSPFCKRPNIAGFKAFKCSIATAMSLRLRHQVNKALEYKRQDPVDHAGMRCSAGPCRKTAY